METKPHLRDIGEALGLLETAVNDKVTAKGNVKRLCYCFVSRIARVQKEDPTTLKFGDLALILPDNLQPKTVYAQLRILDGRGETKSLAEFINSQVHPDNFCDYLRQGGEMHVAAVTKAEGWDKLGSAELLERVEQMAKSQSSPTGTLGALDLKYDWPAKPWDKKAEALRKQLSGLPSGACSSAHRVGSVGAVETSSPTQAGSALPTVSKAATLRAHLLQLAAALISSQQQAAASHPANALPHGAVAAGASTATEQEKSCSEVQDTPTQQASNGEGPPDDLGGEVDGSVASGSCAQSQASDGEAPAPDLRGTVASGGASGLRLASDGEAPAPDLRGMVASGGASGLRSASDGGAPAPDLRGTVASGGASGLRSASDGGAPAPDLRGTVASGGASGLRSASDGEAPPADLRGTGDGGVASRLRSASRGADAAEPDGAAGGVVEREPPRRPPRLARRMHPYARPQGAERQPSRQANPSGSRKRRHKSDGESEDVAVCGSTQLSNATPASRYVTNAEGLQSALRTFGVAVLVPDWLAGLLTPELTKAAEQHVRDTGVAIFQGEKRDAISRDPHGLVRVDIGTEQRLQANVDAEAPKVVQSFALDLKLNFRKEYIGAIGGNFRVNELFSRKIRLR